MRSSAKAFGRCSPSNRTSRSSVDYETLIAAAAEHLPQVVITDIRMPPDFQDEGIGAAKEIRKRQPGTGVVILSQYDDPDYAISLLDEGAAGYAYLLKDRVSDGNRLYRAIREVTTGRTRGDSLQERRQIADRLHDLDGVVGRQERFNALEHDERILGHDHSGRHGTIRYRRQSVTAEGRVAARRT